MGCTRPDDTSHRRKRCAFGDGTEKAGYCINELAVRGRPFEGASYLLSFYAPMLLQTPYAMQKQATLAVLRKADLA